MLSIGNIAETDPQLAASLRKELERQRCTLEMIPSENFASVAVLEAMATVLTNKYSEGYPRRRYYGGNQFIDEVEELAIGRAKKLFSVPHANVQAYSGSPANLSVYFALCKPGDAVLGQNLPDGGHLTHGWKTSITGTFFKSVPYHVRSDGYLDMDEVRRLAMEHKPKLIWCGATAYTRELPFGEFGEIADEADAYLAADIAHIAGLVAGGMHKSPVPDAHIVTTTTHKTLRGPRGAIVMATKKGLDKDTELAEKLDRAIFPGLQGGPHDHRTAAIAVALHEAMQPGFREYARQIVANAKALARQIAEEKLKLVTGGTDNHMLLVDLIPFGAGHGAIAQHALDAAGITVNKNTIPAEPSSPFYPSGIRLGTPTLTTRGMKEQEMQEIAGWIAQVIRETAGYKMPEDKKARKEFLQKFAAAIGNNAMVRQVRSEVAELCRMFPLYPELEY